MNKKMMVGILVLLLVVCVLLMEYMIHSVNAFSFPHGITDPVMCMKIAVFDILFGAISYAIGKLLPEKRQKLSFVAKFVGLWNFFGGILVEVISLIRFLVD